MIDKDKSDAWIIMDELLCEIQRIAKRMRKYRYSKTSELILSIASKIERKIYGECPETFSKEISPLLSTFENEFVFTSPIGQSYRRKCFAELSKIVWKALGSDNNQGELLKETKSFMELIKRKRADIEPTTDLVIKLYRKPNRSSKESILMFNSTCQSYLEAYEGVFFNLLKTVSDFLNVLGKQKANFKEIREGKTNDILRGYKQIFGVSLFFLKNFYEKNYVRNAIAHSQVKPFPEENELRFFSLDQDDKTKVLYNKTMSFERFLLIYLELIDAIDSFYYASELFLVMQSLAFALAQGMVK